MTSPDQTFAKLDKEWKERCANLRAACDLVSNLEKALIINRAISPDGARQIEEAKGKRDEIKAENEAWFEKHCTGPITR